MDAPPLSPPWSVPLAAVSPAPQEALLGGSCPPFCCLGEHPHGSMPHGAAEDVLGLPRQPHHIPIKKFCHFHLSFLPEKHCFCLIVTSIGAKPTGRSMDIILVLWGLPLYGR